MGLLAKAEAYLQWEAEQRIAAERRMAEEQRVLAVAAEKRKAKIKAVTQHVGKEIKQTQVKLTHIVTDFKTKFQSAIKKNYQPKLRRYAAMLLALGLSVQLAEPRTMNDYNLTRQKIANWNFAPQVELTVSNRPTTTNFNGFRDFFTKDVQISKFSSQDRDNLARLLYGEAGRDTVDAVEVLHTVLNRYASPLFKGTMNDIITAKNQYVGFSANHPVDSKLRELVDFVIDEWEAKGCQQVENCDHYYFVTGKPGICNKFEISAKGSQGLWVDTAKKQYAELQHYCPTAIDQATRFNRIYEMEHAQDRTM